MASAAMASPAVDQLLAAIDDAERRRGPWAEKTDVLPDGYVDCDDRLSEIVRKVAETPVTHRWFDDKIQPMPQFNDRVYARWAGRPELAVACGPEWQDHVRDARVAAPKRLVRWCDRCGGGAGSMLLTLALYPPFFVVIALDADCVDELGVRDFTFQPR